jgi:zinc/manganese transport system ATP-binding protein
VISLDRLCVSYGRRAALHSVSGRFEEGSLTAIAGPNGAGKSTLIKAIAGLLRPSNGGMVIDVASEPCIAYLPQVAEIDRGFPIDVADCVAFGFWPTHGAIGGLGHTERNRIEIALKAVGLTGLEARPIAALSSGQFQRVLFARLLVQDAPVILLDEPFAAMDERTTEHLLAIIAHWHAEGRTVIAVLHDAALIRAHFPQTLLLAREMVGWGPTAEVLSDANWRRAREMAEASDDDAAPAEPVTPPTAAIRSLAAAAA